MLESLTIKNVAVIANAHVDFRNGFNVLTGETGAGKSIIIDSINAIIGERINKSLIRRGESKATIAATFRNISTEAENILTELDIDADDEIVIQRSISVDGKTNARINGFPVTVSSLRLLGNELITVCGQHDSQKLLQKSSHVRYIDSLANLSELLLDYKSTYDELKSAQSELNSLSMDEHQKQQQLEFLKYQIDELSAADITDGERYKLNSQKKIIKNRENIIKTLHSIESFINGGDEIDGVTDVLYKLSANLSKLSEFNSNYQSYAESCETLRFDLDECLSDVRNDLYSFDDEDLSLDDIEERLDVIYRMSKKYGNTEADMLERLEQMQNEYNTICFSSQRTEELRDIIKQLTVLANKKAEILHQKRCDAAGKFEKAVSDELSYLNMPDAVFSVNFTKTQLKNDGFDELEFYISPNKGQELKPLNKIASGGELSRIMLAIRCTLSSAETIGTMIFDEIDTGVSGSAAGKIAAKLKLLSGEKQVICVTHLPQIAASADNHLYISKKATVDNTVTDVYPLDFDQRIEEISRIIGGDDITDNVRRSAEELINIHSAKEGTL